MSLRVKDYHPLEQGLRPEPLKRNTLDMHGQRLSSIRTRIKTIDRYGKEYIGTVKDYHPLEQGLRL